MFSKLHPTLRNLLYWSHEFHLVAKQTIREKGTHKEILTKYFIKIFLTTFSVSFTCIRFNHFRLLNCVADNITCVIIRQNSTTASFHERPSPMLDCQSYSKVICLMWSINIPHRLNQTDILMCKTIQKLSKTWIELGIMYQCSSYVEFVWIEIKISKS